VDIVRFSNARGVPTPTGKTIPCLWNPRHDEANEKITDTAIISSRDETDTYSAMVLTSAANAALEGTRWVTATPYETAYANTLIDATTRTHQAVVSSKEARLTYEIKLN
jgi:hypothetical protein